MHYGLNASFDFCAYRGLQSFDFCALWVHAILCNSCAHRVAHTFWAALQVLKPWKVAQKVWATLSRGLKFFDFCALTLFYMGRIKMIPPDWLSYSNPHGMPWMGWFFMTLFLAILESSWVVHFWDFFLKFPKNFTSTIFSTYNPKGGPFYMSKNASIFGSILGSKMVMIQLQIHK